MRRVLLRSSGRRARKAAQPTVSLAARQVKSLDNSKLLEFEGLFFFLVFGSISNTFSNIYHANSFKYPFFYNLLTFVFEFAIIYIPKVCKE